MSVAGCASPYHADRGALLGGLGGAGAGALIGNATGDTAAGALIGAGLGTVAGAAIGSGLDEVEARNRAQIEQQLGRQLATGGVTPADVVAMSRSGIDPELIMNHVRANGMAKKLDANDLIMLQQEGVAKPVITTMQTVGPPQQAEAAQPAPAGYYAAPQPVMVQEYYYPPPPPRFYRPWYGPPPAMGFGFSYSKR
ncbi:MAG: glycine zipper domain-containing protein [Pirellulales bacterium]